MSGSTPFLTDDGEYSQLNKCATEARGSGDIEGAIALLRRAKEHRGDLYQDTRLALYLQAAGHFEEAMAEFSWLLERVEAQATSHCSDPAVERSFVAHAREIIHDKIRLACEREGRLDLAEIHMQLHLKFEAEALALMPSFD